MTDRCSLVLDRLLTVIDYDLIVFLAEGKVIECGSPAELVQIDGPFKKLVAETGKENADVLTRLALAHKFETEQDFEEEVQNVRRRSSIAQVSAAAAEAATRAAKETSA